MSQHDLNIANQTASATRSDINNALVALGSTNSGSSAPTTTYANMMWYDTTANILKIRSEADDAWISIGYLDQSANAFRVFDDTQVTNTSGTQTGLIGDQTTGTWEAGTGTTESLVSPAKVKASILANAPAGSTGFGIVGTYAFCKLTSTYAAISPNLNYAGSSLQYTSIHRSGGNAILMPTNGGTPNGTWQAMGGGTDNVFGGTNWAASLFLRVS